MLRTKLRCCPDMVGGFRKCIEADLGAEVLESAPTNAESIRWSVSWLVLWVLIAMSFPPAARTRLRRPDWLIVQQISSVIPSCSQAWRTEGRAVTLSRSFSMLGRERGSRAIGRAVRESMAGERLMMLSTDVQEARPRIRSD